MYTTLMPLRFLLGLLTIFMTIAMNLAAPIVADALMTNTLAYNFTLSAFNLSLPNSNPAGAALVLGQNGATAGVTPHVTSTRASYPYDDFPSLALTDGSLRAFRKDGSWNTNATEVRSDGPLAWITTVRYARPAPEIYTAITVPLAKYPALAANGRADLWSLCPFKGRLGQTNVMFNISSTTSTDGGYDFDPVSCYRVILFMMKRMEKGVSLTKDSS